MIRVVALRERYALAYAAGVSDDSSRTQGDCSSARPFVHWLNTLVPAMFPSDAALARAVEISPSQVGRWRRGSIPRVDVMRRLATATGVSPEYLLWVVGARPPHPEPMYEAPARRANPPAVLQPVVAAVVVSRLGVLIGRRNDGTPPWTFIAGEQEPDEHPEETAVREVKEETGCEIRPGHVIGFRRHPATERQMIYIAAKPVASTNIVVGDEAELAEVRWVSLGEAVELLPGMYQPVLEYLSQAIPEAAGQ